MTSLDRPSKKQRLDSPSRPSPPSSFSEPHQTVKNQAAVEDIEAARARNDSRLKSAFERIFEKYGRDFSDIGDEIDLQTGWIVIDNGHVEAMTAEGDTGEAEDLDEELSDGGRAGAALGLTSTNEENGDEEAYVLSDLGTPEPGVLRHGNIPRFESGGDSRDRDDSGPDDGSSVDNLYDVRPDNFRRGAGLDTGKAMSVAKGNPASKRPPFPQLVDMDRVKGTHGVDSIWTLPHTAEAFSTPTWKKPRLHSTPAFNTARSASPPGAGSIWSLPRGRGRPSTSGKGKSRKSTNSTTKRKPQPSPVTQRWPSEESTDGSESDDPLQEDQSSPTPTPIRDVRRRRMKSPAHSQGQNPRPNSIPHLMLSTPIKPGDRWAVTQIASNGDPDTQFTPAELHDIDTPDLNKNSLVEIQNSTPSKFTPRRVLVTPDEARLVMKLRQIEKKTWEEIESFVPKNHLRQWSHVHFSKLRKTPPRLSQPWSREELVKLDLFKDLDGLTWTAIQSEFPGRAHAEIEFALLCLWAGDETWYSNEFPGVSMSTKDPSATG